jgi:hypothetical protein
MQMSKLRLPLQRVRTYLSRHRWRILLGSVVLIASYAI